MIRKEDRLVLHAHDEVSAKETVKKLNEIGLPCDLEVFVCYGETGEPREVILHCEFYDAVFAPAEFGEQP